MSKIERLKADDQWELVKDVPFTTLMGKKRCVHLRGKPPLSDYIIHNHRGVGILLRHNLMNEGVFMIVTNKGSKEQAVAKQLALDHNKRLRRGDFL